MTAAPGEHRPTGVARLPKAEIHCHLEGAAAPHLARAKAGKYGERIDDLITPDGLSYRWTDFAGFLAA